MMYNYLLNIEIRGFVEKSLIIIDTLISQNVHCRIVEYDAATLVVTLGELRFV